MASAPEEYVTKIADFPIQMSGKQTHYIFSPGGTRRRLVEITNRPVEIEPTSSKARTSSEGTHYVFSPGGTRCLLLPDSEESEEWEPMLPPWEPSPAVGRRHIRFVEG